MSNLGLLAFASLLVTTWLLYKSNLLLSGRWPNRCQCPWASCFSFLLTRDLIGREKGKCKTLFLSNLSWIFIQWSSQSCFGFFKLYKFKFARFPYLVTPWEKKQFQNTIPPIIAVKLFQICSNFSSYRSSQRYSFPFLIFNYYRLPELNRGLLGEVFMSLCRKESELGHMLLLNNIRESCMRVQRAVQLHLSSKNLKGPIQGHFCSNACILERYWIRP